MRNTFLFITILTLFTGFFAVASDDGRPVKLWPGKVPGEEGRNIGEEKVQEPKPGQTKSVTRLTNVTEPTITVHKPAPEKDTGAAVVVCPGGGYNILAIDHEGHDIVKWLNEIGVTGILLKYRVPRRKDLPKHQAPLQDAQRALRIVRSNAKKWDIDPDRIGIMGFSAGGHLSATASATFDKPAYETVDEIDKTPRNPNFVMLIYPAYLIDDEDRTKTASELTLSDKIPPTIIIITGDDRFAEGAVRYYLALKAAKVSAELHVYPKGGHGYGLRKSENLVSTWPDRCEDWLRHQGLLR